MISKSIRRPLWYQWYVTSSWGWYDATQWTKWVLLTVMVFISGGKLIVTCPKTWHAHTVLTFIHTKRTRKRLRLQMGAVIFYSTIHTGKYQRSKKKFAFVFTFTWCGWSIRNWEKRITNKGQFTVSDCVCDFFLWCVMSHNVNSCIEINGTHLLATSRLWTQTFTVNGA